MSPLPARWLLALVLAVVLCSSAGVAQAGGWTPADVHAAIDRASAKYGVSWRLLDRIVRCETAETYSPYARGDWSRRRGRFESHGAIQLHERGLLDHYRRVTGGASAYDPYAALDYLARVATGEFRREDVTLNHWSCY